MQILRNDDSSVEEASSSKIYKEVKGSRRKSPVAKIREGMQRPLSQQILSDFDSSIGSQTEVATLERRLRIAKDEATELVGMHQVQEGIMDGLRQVNKELRALVSDDDYELVLETCREHGMVQDADG